jgi:hypothetical protein
MEFFSIIIAFFSLVVAGIALGWNIYRDCVERGKLKVTAYVADVFIPGSGQQPEVISVRVTNTGKKPIVIDGHSFLLKNKTKLMPMDSYAAFNNRRLEPGEYISTTLSNALVLNLLDRVGDLYGFFVMDSCGKKWWLSDKEISDIIKSLIKLKPNQTSSRNKK